MENVYQGNYITVKSMPTAVMGYNGIVKGDNVYIAKDDKIEIGGDAIWIMELGDKIQNIKNFMKGVELVDKYASSGRRNKCFQILKKMSKTPKKGGEDYSRLVAAFCDMGLWENDKNLCIPHLYNKDFDTYLKNLMWNYYMDK